MRTFGGRVQVRHKEELNYTLINFCTFANQEVVFIQQNRLN